jgi:hypothetical protein
MNEGAAAHEPEAESNWDSLAAELGLEPSAPPALHSPPKPADALPPTTTPKPKARPPIEEEEPTTPFGGHEIHHAHVTEITMEVTKVGDASDDMEIDENTVEDAPDVFDDEASEADETAPADAKEGEGGVRRRRRRRRRRKGGPDITEADAGEVESTADDEGLEAVEAIDSDAEELEAPAELVDEAAQELEEEAEEVPGPAAAIDEEIDEDNAEPLPEWKVTAWTDLVATLYRPQDR